NGAPLPTRPMSAPAGTPCSGYRTVGDVTAGLPSGPELAVGEIMMSPCAVKEIRWPRSTGIPVFVHCRFAGTLIAPAGIGAGAGTASACPAAGVWLFNGA